MTRPAVAVLTLSVSVVVDDHGVHAGEQLARAVGFGEVVVRAKLEADHLVDHLAGAEDDQRDVAFAAAGLGPPMPGSIRSSSTMSTSDDIAASSGLTVLDDVDRDVAGPEKPAVSSASFASSSSGARAPHSMPRSVEPVAYLPVIPS